MAEGRFRAAISHGLLSIALLVSTKPSQFVDTIDLWASVEQQYTEPALTARRSFRRVKVCTLRTFTTK
jgi:hypothetical protein